MTDAATIYQDHLDRVSVAIWTGSFDVAAAAMDYPHPIETTDAWRLMRDAADYVDAVRGFRESLTRLGATAYHRIVDEAAFAEGDPDRIEGRHTAFILRGGSYVIDPHRGEMTLLRRDGRWLCARLSVEVRNADVTIVNPVVALVAERPRPIPSPRRPK